MQEIGHGEASNTCDRWPWPPQVAMPPLPPAGPSSSCSCSCAQRRLNVRSRQFFPMDVQGPQ